MTDQPDPELTDADDVFVRSLLADVPAVAMPDDVVARIRAALADEPDVVAATTVVPLAGRRRSAPRLLQAAAAVVLVVGGGAFAVKALGGSGDSASRTTSGAASAAGAETGAPPVVTSSGTAYTQASLGGAALDLVTKARSSGSQAAPSAPPSTAFAARLADDSQVLTQCIVAVQGNPVLPQRAITVDIGTFEGKPAVVVVVQSTDPQVLTTYVTTPNCGTTPEPTILYFANVRRP